MSLEGIVAGDYGQQVQLTVIDTDTDAAADVSAYTTAQQILFRKPDGSTIARNAAFESDGSDGIVSYTLADGDIDVDGRWAARARVTTGSAQLTSLWEEFDVEA